MDYFEKPSIHRQNRRLVSLCASQANPATREEAVEALRHAEAKYRSMVENAVEGIFQTTPDGHYLSANPALARIYGYQSTDELVRSIGDIEQQLYVDSTRRDDFVMLMERDSVVTGFESEIRRKDGSVIWISENARAVRNLEGQIEYYEGTVVDISARKQSESLHREKEAAEASSRAKSQFLAHMSHELRTPLNGVIGMLDLLTETTLSQQQQRYASIARSSADLLLGVINEILDLSKIEAGKLELEHIDYELRSLIESALEMLGSKARQKGLELTLQMPPEQSMQVRGDPQRLQQVIVNLLTNAIKFTSRGQVQVRVTLESESDENYVVRLAVEDTGVGIPADRLDRLFRPFSQVDASTTRQFGGTGLGLAISKQLVELMGGKIGVRSQENAGSTFWFRVPLEKPRRKLTQDCVMPREIAGLRILAVDDNATNREILFRQLSAWKFRVELAPDGATALEMLRQAVKRGKSYAMALVDGDMPGIDGYELARRVQADGQLSATPLIMLTSLGTQPAGVDFAELGIAGCMTKPVRQSQLFDTIVGVAVKHESRKAACPSTNSSSDVAAEIEAVLPDGDLHSIGRVSTARLLLAEDNEINQMVALEILQHAGFQCDVAPNGREAIKRVLEQSYDIVLMDCQMPEMDGLTAAREIRRLEADGPLGQCGYRLPIVALTANAVEGDRQMCLDAGMDDYLSKPLDSVKLIHLLNALLAPQIDSANAEVKPISESNGRTLPGSLPGERSNTPPLDLEALIQRCLGNLEFVDRLLRKFAQRLPDDIQRLKTDIVEGRFVQVAQLAHSIKGLAANMSADQLHCLVGELEVACRRHNKHVATVCLANVLCEADRCLQFIAQHVGKNKAVLQPILA